MNKWDKRFMEMAGVVATWSSCYQDNRQVGAVIVKDKRILTTGYNGASSGITSCKDRGECLRKKLGIASGTRQEICYAVHAEQNAIISAARKDVIGSTLYLVGKEVQTGEYVKNAMPCMFCKRFIINAGIVKIVVRNDKEDYTEVDVDNFIVNDDSLEGVFGY